MNQLLSTLFLFLSLTTSALGEDRLLKIMSENFEYQHVRKFFGMMEITSFYQWGACTNNIFHLLEKASKEGQDLSNFKVIYVISYGPNDLNSSFYRDIMDSRERRFLPNPETTRFSTAKKPVTYNLHVFLEANGKVYDFDFGMKPKSIEKNRFYNLVFYHQKNQQPNKDFTLRSFPADFYLENYVPTDGSKETESIPGNYIEFIKGNINGTEFPLELMRDYISSST